MITGIIWTLALAYMALFSAFLFSIVR